MQNCYEILLCNYHVAKRIYSEIPILGIQIEMLIMGHEQMQS